MDLSNSQLIPCARCTLRAKIFKLNQLNIDWICSSCRNNSGAVNLSNSSQSHHNIDELPLVNSSFNQENTILEITDKSHIFEPQVFPKGIKFFYNNINGIRSKFCEVKDLLTNTPNIAIFAISETKLKERDISSQYEINGYNSIRNDRIIGEGGGSIVYVNNLCNFEIIEMSDVPPEFIECTIVKLKLTGIKPILLCILYVPPNQVNDACFEFLSVLCVFLKSTNLEILIMGDMNINIFQDSLASKKLNRIFKEFDLCQKVETPTRIQCKKMGEIIIVCLVL